MGWSSDADEAMSARRRIFLAHAHEDKAQVRKLYADLKARGFDPWLDEIDLMPGQIWKTEIPNAIRHAEMFLACLSRRSIEKRGYVQREFRQALSAFAERPAGSIYLIPVRLDDCEVPDLEIPDLELNLRDIQWVDLWQEGGLERLVAAINRALGERMQNLPEPATVLRDAPWCPELVVVPAGAFMMGSTEPERRWAIAQGAMREFVDQEKPQHRVAIPEPFAVGRHPVTRSQFATFVEATGHDMSGGCWIWTGEKVEQSATADWCAPGFEQTDEHPVVGVSWEDATAYVEWLSRETGQPYRLLSEAEWEYACRAGTTTRYSWGDDPPTPERANFGGNMDGTTAVGAHPPNSFGLCDMHGNVLEWVEDCWNESYAGAPNDGSAWTSGDCGRRVLRGGSWLDNPGTLRSVDRGWGEPGNRKSGVGFRVARTLSRSESVTP
jgi:formylglycine-generating enzyme required for sulfatase activity